MTTATGVDELAQRDKGILRALTERLRDELDERFLDLIVFGSRARGDADADSDLDVLVLVDRVDSSLIQRVRAVRYEVMWAYDFEPLISLICWDQRTFHQRRRTGALAFNVEREGRIFPG